MTEPDLHAVLFEALMVKVGAIFGGYATAACSELATDIIAALREHPEMVMREIGMLLKAGWCVPHERISYGNNDPDCHVVPVYAAPSTREDG